MASTSAASSIQKSFTYEVFLSFRGEDTRKNFVDHLYHALKEKSIITYRDDKEIKKGKKISDELIRSIKDSRFYIIVFSKNYASSSWCLEELVHIMECQKTDEQTAYPVFYDVEPTEVRNQSGAVGVAFDKHKDKEAAGKWRDVLREAADLAGSELKSMCDGHEAQFIQEIVKEISLELRFVNSSFDGKLVGMETRVRDVVSSLEIDNLKDVRMIGIQGMGGAGKTTLARAVFDQISSRFEGLSFVQNVRETSKTQLCGLESLQKKVLSDVLNDSSITIKDVSEFRSRMKYNKVLLVLDDVDHRDQLEALAGELDWFGPGSRVIITTREGQVLVAHQPVKLILDVNLLLRDEAICLFSRYAFGREIPIQGYEELSKQVVRYAAGLPLTIKVLGSELCRKSEVEWEDTLERLKTIPLNETLKKLELSYDSLDEDCKEIFLDVACILKGWMKEKAIVALESCGFHAIRGLKILEQKSLITYNKSKKSLITYMDMHDHIEEMGKNIVRRLHPNEPSQHSRLWIKGEVEEILREDEGTEATTCLKLCAAEPLILMEGLKKMKKLRFLEVEWLNEETYDEYSQYLPNCLQYLRLKHDYFTCLPTNFQANNLVGLSLGWGDIQQLCEWGEKKFLKKLKFLDLEGCGDDTLDIGLFPNLEWLTLESRGDLELQMPVKSCKLKSLKLFDTRFRTLDLVLAQNLNNLIVKHCKLEEIHMPVEGLNLKHLSLQRCNLKTLNLTHTPNLETLEVQECEDLVELHMPVESLKLKRLSLQRCKLKTLNLTHTPNLETLEVHDCEDLVELHMPIETLKLKRLSLRCCKLKTLNLMRSPNLETLNVENCKDLVELHMPVERLKLKDLNFQCSKLRIDYLVLSPM